MSEAEPLRNLLETRCHGTANSRGMKKQSGGRAFARRDDDVVDRQSGRQAPVVVVPTVGHDGKKISSTISGMKGAMELVAEASTAEDTEMASRNQATTGKTKPNQNKTKNLIALHASLIKGHVIEDLG